MEIERIKVIALDLDGTLTNDKKEVAPRTRAALRAAAAKGVSIALTTGRPTEGVEPLARDLKLEQMGGYILSYNGGVILDCHSKEFVLCKELSSELVGQLCAFAAEQKVVISTYGAGCILTKHDKNPWLIKESFNNKLPIRRVDDLASVVTWPIFKMLLTVEPERMDTVCSAARKRFADKIDLYPSSAFFLEAMPLGVAKDTGLARLLEHLGLSRKNLMACGDGLNDCSMLEYAGLGIAMQNADPSVKAVADYVTQADNNHDGVAEAIEKFVL